MEQADGYSLLTPDGVHSFEWGIRGMDCPDCAMKATKAVSRLPGIESCKISVTEGPCDPCLFCWPPPSE